MRELDLKNLDFLIESKCEFGDAWTEQMLISGIESGNLKGLIYGDDENKGYLTYSVSFESADVECVYVKKEHRREGIAKLLFAEMIKRLKEEKVERILLEVRASNIPAIGLYESLGFKKIYVRKKYYPDGEDGIIYLKENLI